MRPQKVLVEPNKNSSFSAMESFKAINSIRLKGTHVAWFSLKHQIKPTILLGKSQNSQTCFHHVLR